MANFSVHTKENTTKFFQQYVSKGGKLLIEGTATHDFAGKDISATWKAISSKAVATSFSLNNVAKLCIEKNLLTDGVTNEVGSYTFTNDESLKTNIPATFSFTYHGNIYTGSYKGLAAIKLATTGKLQKLAATCFSSLSKNGKSIVHIDKEADVFISVDNGIVHSIIADKTKSIKMFFNK